MENEIKFKYIESAGFTRAIIFPSFLIAVVFYIVGLEVYKYMHIIPLNLYIFLLAIVSVIMYTLVGKKCENKNAIAIFLSDELILRFSKKEIKIPYKSIYCNKRVSSGIFVYLDLRYNKNKRIKLRNFYYAISKEDNIFLELHNKLKQFICNAEPKSLNINNIFPFDEELKSVIACKHIFKNNEPILYVSRDGNGNWTMSCGKKHNESESIIVSLKEIFDFDNSIGQLSNLPVLSYATRDKRLSSWEIRE